MTRSPQVVAGRYQVNRLIARGGMASVFLAEHIALHRPVALKILHPPPGMEASEDANFERRFRLEAETLAGLDHPNIVVLHDYGQTDDGRFFLAMEYIDGPRFTDLIAAGAIEADHALRLILQVCAALRYAHKRGVVHRDLKPSNLLLTVDSEGNDRVKVVDFGLVKVGEIDQSLTREGVVLGSPHCMAPEQVQGLPLDHRADIYAIGILLFRSLTGTYPFHGSTSTATMMAHLQEPIPAFAKVAPSLHLSSRVEEIVRRCLAKQPEERYPDVSSLAADLQRAIGLPAEPDASQSLTMVEESPAPPSSPDRRYRPLVLALSAALAAAVVFGGWWAFGPSSRGSVAAVPPTPTIEALAVPEAVAAPVPAPSPVAVEPAPPEPVPEEVVAVAPLKPAPKPAVAPKPAAGVKEKPAENPEGYMPLPDDLR